MGAAEGSQNAISRRVPAAGGQHSSAAGTGACTIYGAAVAEDLAAR